MHAHLLSIARREQILISEYPAVLLDLTRASLTLIYANPLSSYCIFLTHAFGDISSLFKWAMQ